MKSLPWIGTSWKMNKTRKEALAFAQVLKASPLARNSQVQLFVVLPFPDIANVAAELAGTQIMVGAQNMHWADQGAWTGEISPLMVKDCGATLVEICGGKVVIAYRPVWSIGEGGGGLFGHCG